MILLKTFLAAVLAGGLLLVGTSVAAAQEVDTYDETPGDVIGDDVDDNDVGGDDTADAYDDDPPERDQPGDGLPVTGGDIAGLAVIGGITLVAGVALTRRRRHTS